MKEISWEDSFRSAEVALKALNNCLDILEELSKVTLDRREKVNQAILLGNSLKNGLYQKFPTLR